MQRRSARGEGANPRVSGGSCRAHGLPPRAEAPREPGSPELPQEARPGCGSAHPSLRSPAITPARGLTSSVVPVATTTGRTRARHRPRRPRLSVTLTSAPRSPPRCSLVSPATHSPASGDTYRPQLHSEASYWASMCPVGLHLCLDPTPPALLGTGHRASTRGYHPASVSLEPKWLWTAPG